MWSLLWYFHFHLSHHNDLCLPLVLYLLFLRHLLLWWIFLMLNQIVLILPFQSRHHLLGLVYIRLLFLFLHHGNLVNLHLMVILLHFHYLYLLSLIHFCILLFLLYLLFLLNILHYLLLYILFVYLHNLMYFLHQML